ncbi:hypothetical protein BDV93DRAFT_541188 [Ceratobasidium sp. AG-I]|nr:hypothetical protein BDV93DRAFT_541188 [Ceratobasidium sp. AG-I]
MSTLETQVTLLAGLIDRVSTVREVTAGNLPVHLRSAITNVSSLAEELSSSAVQNALASAEVEQDLKANDLQNSRREIRKQKLQVGAAPPVKRPTSKKQSYPPNTSGHSFGHLTRQYLPSFVQQFNQTNQDIKMSLWTPTHSAVGQNGVIRIVVSDVLVGYITLRSRKEHHDSLGIETVSVTGIREQRATSEFTVFRAISQHIFKILAQHGDMPVPDVVSMLISYRDIYTAVCVKCGCIFSPQDSTPTIERIWTETGPSQWNLEFYHESCVP